MARVAGHALIAVSQRLVGCRHSPGLAVDLHGLCQPRFFVVMQIARSDGVEYLDYLPLLAGVHHGPLEQAIIFPIETARLPWGSQHREIGTSGWRYRSRGLQRGPLADGPVTIHAIHFDRVARFTIQFSVPMVVLRKMTILAMHSLLEV